MKRRLVLMLLSMILCGSTVFAQSNHWSLDNPGAYASHLNTWIAVELDGVRLASTDIELAAFVEGECRGVERLAVYNPDWGYLASIQIFKDNAGDVITFKMYDHATETEYDDCSTTVTTQVAGEEMGATPMDPTIAVFTSPEPVGPTGPEHPWVPASFPSNMSIFAEIQINGVPQSGDNWEVGAFCGDECRGDQVGTVPAPTEFGQMLSMVVYGVDGDVMNFYLYDIENQSIVGECATTVTYVEQGNAGVVWDPLILNFISLQTFTKDIAAYTENGGYYLIASPIGEVSPEDVTNMLSNSYDLYYFNQSQDLEWINYKPSENSSDPGFNLLPGKGYLYANNQNVTLKFTGQAYNGDGDVTLVKDDDANFPGWNLVGNPFAQTAYITKSFFTINSDGSEIIAGTGNSVEAMEGIFVVAEEDGEVMNFSTENPNQTKSQIVLNVTKDRSNAIDRAIVRFGQGDVLPKFMLNQNNTKMYIPQDDDDFAVVRSNRDGKLPVSFEPSEDGVYSISVNSENVHVRFLHLIDHQVDVEVDLLQNPNYVFKAKTTDPADRFTLVFKTGHYKELFASDSGSFSFCNNGNWIIDNEGDAILQVIDVNGQILSSEEISGCVSKHIEAAPGVYMLRLVNGSDVKVQKIVVE